MSRSEPVQSLGIGYGIDIRDDDVYSQAAAIARVLLQLSAAVPLVRIRSLTRPAARD